ncbi:hypothetical protein MASR2M15_05980 [Anaerolineales bacterium]
MMPTALIIDDNAMNLETLSVLLRKEGVKVVTLSSPANIETFIANQNQLQIVFLDLEFPNHCGIDLIHKLKQIPELSETPIIAYSVHINELKEVRRAGFDGFIGKPLNIEHFPDQLRRILSGEVVWDTDS